jgi:hypothetical protein
MWIAAIEYRYEMADVIACKSGEMVAHCKNWTVEELELLYSTLDDYIFSDYLDEPYNIVRTTSQDYAGMAVARSDNYGNPYFEIRISDLAYKAPPAMGLLDFFDLLISKPEHFQGTIAHELTHLATRFHPELLDWWIEGKEASGVELGRGNWRLGLFYDWGTYDELENDAELYYMRVEEEQFAMATSALMYEPSWARGP